MMQQDIKDRILASAEELFSQSETGEFPSVEAVRQHSRASMNYVVEVLKEWRHMQRQQMRTTREPLPPVLQETMQQVGQTIWETAQALANASLDTARAAFDAEKSDLAKLSAEQSEAFEAVSAELEQVRAEATHFADTMNTRLETARAEAEQLRAELAQVRAKAETAEQMHTERMQQVEAELQRARHESAEAREAAALLRGQLDATASHNTALLAALAPVAKEVKQ